MAGRVPPGHDALTGRPSTERAGGTATRSRSRLPGGTGPAPAYATALAEEDRTAVREELRARLPVGDDGAIALRARAWAVRGRSVSSHGRSGPRPGDRGSAVVHSRGRRPQIPATAPGRRAVAGGFPADRHRAGRARRAHPTGGAP